MGQGEKDAMLSCKKLSYKYGHRISYIIDLFHVSCHPFPCPKSMDLLLAGVRRSNIPVWNASIEHPEKYIIFPNDYIYYGSEQLEINKPVLLVCFIKTFFFQFLSANNIDKEVSYKILDKFVELGGNFIDTADAYNEGESEEIIGEWMKSKT